MPWLSLTLEVGADSADVLGDALLEAGALSVTVLDPDTHLCRVSALLALDADPETVLRTATASSGVTILSRQAVARVEDDDWVRRTQSQFAPIVFGERLWVGPGWHQPPAGSAAAVVWIDPGMAFGTGSHASTRLMLEYLAGGDCKGKRVLDYGCGSGILAVAAAKLGASEVDAVDIDAQSVATATENAERNRVALRPCLPEALEPRAYDLVLANILAQPLILLAPLLAARVAPDGRIALSGILDSQADEVAAAYAPSFAMRRALAQDGWTLLEGARK